VPREKAEIDESFRQVIPYVILSYKDQVVVYKRTTKGGEERLYNLLSVGLGGHISLADIKLNGEIIDPRGTLIEAVDRELDEELNHSRIINREFIGVIFDDSDEVSRVHLGLVEMWQLEKSEIASKEPDVAECEFCRINDLPNLRDKMENWSRLSVDYLTNR
jgi:predicted NUDIX family phosphoesterase